MKYNPSLDVLRVIAVALVVAFHSLVPGFRGGWLGVDLFFVLSGFLITRLLLAEHLRTGHLNIGAFWIRRLRRLSPAVFLMLACYLCVLPFLSPYPMEKALRDVAMSMVYVADYQMAYSQNAPHIGHMWSLMIEEKYYLLWPVMLLACLRMGKHTRSFLLLLIGAAMISRWWTVRTEPWDVVYYAFHNRLTGLMIGSAAAILYRQIRVSSGTMLLIGATFLAIAVTFARWGDHQAPRLWMLLAEIGSLVLVLACVENPTVLSFTRLAPLGKYTYGVYLWHVPIVAFMLERHFAPLTMLVVSGGLGLILSAISLHTIERWLRAPPRTSLGGSVQRHDGPIHKST